MAAARTECTRSSVARCNSALGNFSIVAGEISCVQHALQSFAGTVVFESIQNQCPIQHRHVLFERCESIGVTRYRCISRASSNLPGADANQQTGSRCDPASVTAESKQITQLRQQPWGELACSSFW